MKILNLFEIKKISKIKEVVKEEIVENISYDNLLYAKIVELLISNPNDFSARWFCGSSIDFSVRSSNGKILISEYGDLIHPVSISMTKLQKSYIKNLIAPIFKKDKEYLIKKLIE